LHSSIKSTFNGIKAEIQGTVRVPAALAWRNLVKEEDEHVWGVSMSISGF